MSKRNKTLNSFFQVRTTETAETGPSAQTTDTPNVRAELKPGDVESDPGKRIPIEELDPDIRDLARREYISMGPCQPTDHTYEKINGRSFHDYWFNNHRGWLEYSIEKKSAFCFYCFLFKQPRAENYGIEAFTRNGFKSWKDGPKVFNQHVGKHDSAHNKSRQHYEDFKNQRQNLPHVFDRGSQKQEEEYKARLLIILDIVKFLILQALAFRGHDESSSSMNKGNFKELLDLFIKKDPKVAKLFGDAGENHKLTSHKIQKDLCKACAKETTNVILEEIGDSKFALLVDESRDASMKEQMAMCLRYLGKRGDAVKVLEGRSYPLPYRWTGAIDHTQKERSFFTEKPEYVHLAHRMGVEHLVKSISKHLEDLVKSKFSATKLFKSFDMKSAKKRLLQGYSLRSFGSYPIYEVSTEGPPHDMRFRCTVRVRDQAYASLCDHRHLREAEEDAAAVAYKDILGDDNIDMLLEMVNKANFHVTQTLKEFTIKKSICEPDFSSSMVHETCEMTLWLSTVEVGGQVFIGEPARSKQVSIRKAASSAITSFLEDGDALMVSVVQGKRLVNAVPTKLKHSSTKKHPRKRRKIRHE